jgi:hypothetical protein
MIFFKRFCLNKGFVCFLTVAFSVLSFVSSSPAMFIPSLHEGSSSSDRNVDLQKIQRVLESKLVQHKLSQLGLTTEDVEARLHQLDDQQIHQIVTQIDGLNAGGDSGAVWVIVLVLLGVIVFLVLEMTGVIDVLKW